ncbi:vomeronasal type-2 receptor 26-like [Dendropsophus ebraccatus]|uniref:vomeronasal type-2 receptor 26-like n=1 Tax=Dendropsophus ebraccatus TaxID=150705 RepID=UPI0038317972
METAMEETMFAYTANCHRTTKEPVQHHLRDSMSRRYLHLWVLQFPPEFQNMTPMESAPVFSYLTCAVPAPNISEESDISGPLLLSTCCFLLLWLSSKSEGCGWLTILVRCAVPHLIAKADIHHDVCRAHFEGIIHSLIFLFAIYKINRNPDILPNITLGYHIYDSCLDERVAVQRILHLLSGPDKNIPNYSCRSRTGGQLAGVIGDYHSYTTIPVAQILGLYGYPQISYGATDPSLSDRRLYPHVFRTVQSHLVHNMVITKLVKHFGWTWVGILVSDDDVGENELRILTKYMREDGICAAFIIKLTWKLSTEIFDILESIHNLQVNIIVICGTYSRSGSETLHCLRSMFSNITLILPPSWAFGDIITQQQLSILNGSLAVDFSSQDFPGVEDFMRNYRKLPNIFKTNDDEELWSSLDEIGGNAEKDSFILVNKTNEEDDYNIKFSLPNLITHLSSGVAPNLYHAVEILGKSLHEMFLYIKDKYQENSIPGLIHYTQRLQRYIQRLKSSPDPMRPSYYFNDQGEAVHPYRIINWVHRDSLTHIVKVGKYTPWDVSGPELYVNTQSITWKYKQEVPVSRCSDPCLPGSRKMARRTIHTCCYDCVPCSKGEISNKTDSENCMKCPIDEWPNEKRDGCLPKVLDFISYHNDTMASVFSCVSLFGCLVTGSILGIFISYRDTPIVRANNRNLSYLLLVSIILSFLSVFLFLGRPSDVTCRLRETSFGVFFSVAISSLLAKTVMVCVAFKSTKPGSPWRKWLSVKVPYTIVLLCSSIQVIICVIWLSISPPFQDLDTQSYPGKILIQCNAGSDIWFFSMLGYLGFLAAVSFVLAFMVRTLPDTFNEAKYITFSMLVFCSVWITMIPAYLTTRGKNMVAVEVFAVMASSAGLLGCVFIPKCFIILFRSEMNRKTNLLGKRKK